MSVRDELDKLLEFYDAHKPDMKGKPVRVYLSKSTVEKFASTDGDKLMYRGFEIVPLNKPKAKQASQ